jgi:hypothetical protein
VGECGREIIASATCQLHFAKASAATPPKQEKNETAGRDGSHRPPQGGSLARFDVDSSNKFEWRIWLNRRKLATTSHQAPNSTILRLAQQRFLLDPL